MSKAVKNLYNISGAKTQKDFGKIVGEPQNHVTKYLSGKINITLVKFQKWCDAVGVSDYNEVFK